MDIRKVRKKAIERGLPAPQVDELIKSFGDAHAAQILGDWLIRGKAAKSAGVTVGYKDLPAGAQSLRAAIDALKAEVKGLKAPTPAPARETFWSTSAAARVKAHADSAAFWGLQRPTSKARTHKAISVRSFFGTETERKQLMDGDPADAVQALADVLKLPQALVDQLSRMMNAQQLFDLLKTTVEAQGGRVEIVAEVTA